MLLNFNPHRKAGEGVVMEEGIFEGALRDGTGTHLVEKRKDNIPGRTNSRELTTPHGTFVQKIKRCLFLKTLDCHLPEFICLPCECDTLVLCPTYTSVPGRPGVPWERHRG